MCHILVNSNGCIEYQDYNHSQLDLHFSRQHYRGGQQFKILFHYTHLFTEHDNIYRPTTSNITMMLQLTSDMARVDIFFR